MCIEIHDGWEISDSAYSHDDILQNGNRMFSGNGYMGMRGTVDEASAEDMVSLIVNGMYDRYADKWREPVNIPDPLCIRIAPRGSSGILSLHNGECEIVFHEQKIDYRYGLFSRKTVWKADESEITVESSRFVSMENEHLLCTKYAVTSDSDFLISLQTLINNEVYDCNGPHFKLMTQHETESGAGMYTVCSYRTLENKIPFSVAQYVSDMQKEIILKKGEPFVLYVYGAVYCGIDYDSNNRTLAEKINGDAFDCLNKSVEKGFDELYLQHRRKWDAVWLDGDVEIEGDKKAQEDVRYSLYQLHCTAPRGQKNLSVPARGLSGQTYKGAVFWDTEMFILPYFLYTDPGTAKNFIRYRIRTLAGALKKAKSYGYIGAFYAWESQENGDDACSDYNVTDVFTKRPLRTYFKDKQIHISAAVVYAIKQYIDATDDYSILLEGGFEVIAECALFYLSRCIYLPLKQRYEFHDVIGPDEYHERVDNNAYTNRMALFTFETVLTYWNEFQKDDNTFILNAAKKMKLEKYIPQIQEICKKIYIPRPVSDDSSPCRNVIPQFDGYFLLENCSVSDVRKRLLNPKEYWGGANGVASQTQVIKQADIVLMLSVFDDEYTEQVKSANYTYYSQRTEHGSSLSSCMYGLLACRIGKKDDAYAFFKKTAETDLSGDSKQFAGLIYIGGTHPAAEGGTWMMVVNGFCGYKCRDGKISLSPDLPESWKSVTFTVKVRGTGYLITVTKEGYKICQK
jgi:trehalose/maltose hydrolase-like predicted phosphorylase